MARKNKASRGSEPGLWMQLGALTAPMLDAVAVMAPGNPAQYGFAEEGRCYRRDGWVGLLYVDGNGMDWTRATAAGESMRVPGFDATWLDGDCKITRLDVCRDVVGAPVCPELLGRWCGTRGAATGKSAEQYIQSGEGATVYVGSRRSGLMVRVYRKSTPQQRTPGLCLHWLEGGWDGTSPVTRVEFEVKGAGLGDLTAGEVVESLRPDRQNALAWRLWGDALARRRLAAKPVAQYSQAQKAPTDTGWERLGEPLLQSRVRVTSVTSHLAVRLERLLRREGKRGMEPADLVAAFTAAMGKLEDEE